MKFKPELSTAVLERQLLDREFSAAWEAGRVRLGKAVCSFPNFPALPISHTARS